MLAVHPGRSSIDDPIAFKLPSLQSIESTTIYRLYWMWNTTQLINGEFLVRAQLKDSKYAFRGPLTLSDLYFLFRFRDLACRRDTVSQQTFVVDPLPCTAESPILV